MIERIILNIRHSDDYTDYLFQTACLKNSHVIPMADASEEELKENAVPGALILLCEGLYHDPFLKEPAVWVSRRHKSILIISEYYLHEDGSIDYSHAEMVRQQVAAGILEILEDRQNIREVYRHYFGLLWNNRERIYNDPRLFFANTAILHRLAFVRWISIGAMQKTIERYPEYFSVPGVHCSHPCKRDVLLTDFQYVKDYVSGEWEYELYFWCPECNRSFCKTIEAPDNWALMSDLIEKVCKEYDGVPSSFTIFDVIDEVSITR